MTGVEDEGKRNAWEYYVNEVHEMDKFVGQLIDAIEQRGEPTVIVFYGDHLPTLGLEAKDLKGKYLYNTNYVIWDNIGLEKKDGNIAAYQIMAEVFDRLDIHTGTIFNYHQQRRQTKNYLADLELLQYDIMYGKQYVWNQENPFKATDLQFGIRPLTVTKVYETKDSIFIVGNNFTNFCQVFNGDVKINTTYHNEHLLEVSKKDLKDGDTFKVSIVSKALRVLSSSNEYVYQEKSEK